MHVAPTLTRSRLRTAAALLALAVTVCATTSSDASSVTATTSCGTQTEIRPGVYFQRCTARLSDYGATQSVYKVSWKLGDPRVHLQTELMGEFHPSDDSIGLDFLSSWAHAHAPAGLAAMMNGDYFTYSSTYDAASTTGLVVKNRKMYGYDPTSAEPVAGFAPAGRLVLGTPEPSAQRIYLPGGTSATVGAIGARPVMSDQVGVYTHAGEHILVKPGYTLVSLAENPFAKSLVAAAAPTIKNPTGADRNEKALRFIIHDAKAVPAGITEQLLPVKGTPAGATYIRVPGGGVVLAFKSTGVAATGFARVLQEAKPAVSVGVTDSTWQPVTDTMAGKPFTLIDGRAVMTRPAYVTTDQWSPRQWRPAIGTTADGYGMMVVVGSTSDANSWTVQDTTEPEFAQVLKSLGMRNGLAFDNRSSTELYRPSASRSGGCESSGTCSTEYGYERDIPAGIAISSS